MEPIRSAVYGGGLWAQIIENPSFEENLWSANAITHMVSGKPELARSSGSGLPLPWESLEARQGARFEPRWGDAANSFRSLLLLGLPRGQTGVRQALYLPVHRVLRYTGSIFAKPISGEKKIEISLRRRDRADEFFARR
jgi:alpha-N-arabinofuranosidase